MTKPFRSIKSRGIRNLKSAAKDFTRSSVRIGSKATVGTFKWLATNHNPHADYLSAELGEKLSINWSGAYSRFTGRRLKRKIDLNQRVIDGFKDADAAEIVGGWVMDFVLFILDLLWGCIEPVLSYLLLVLFYSLLMGLAALLGVFLFLLLVHFILFG